MYSESLTRFQNRLKKIGIDVILSANYPWIYIDTINNKRVSEKFLANHGFTVAFLSTKYEDKDKIKYPNLREVFKLIRTYKIKS